MKYLILLLLLSLGGFVFINSLNALDIILWTLKLTLKLIL